MPHDELHIRKRKKNLMILALIFAWCALIWGVTMVKMAHGAEDNADLRYKTQRANHQAEIEQQGKYYQKRGKQHAKEMIAESEDVTTRSVVKPGEVIPEGYRVQEKQKLKLRVK